MIGSIRLAAFVLGLTLFSVTIFMITIRQHKIEGQIVFVSNRDDEGKGEIYSIRPDGSDLQRLTDSPETKCYPRWLPGGQEFVFVTDPTYEAEYFHICDSASGGLYRMLADGSHLSETTQYLFGSFSPDGFWVTLAKQDYEIYVARSDGTNIRRITNTPQDTENYPVWSPDGKWIIFTCYCNPKDIYIVSAHGGSIRRLTNTDGRLYGYPIWSPDSQWIAFISDGDGIYRIRPDGSDLQLVISESDLDKGGFSIGEQLKWSPDGKWLLFPSKICSVSENPIYPACSFSRIGVNGGDLLRLTTNGSEPSWSPDSQWIVFASVRDGDANIYRISVDGTVLEQLTDDPAQDISPVWSPIVDLTWRNWLLLGISSVLMLFSLILRIVNRSD